MTDDVVMIGHLSMSIPALKKRGGLLTLPEFLQGGTGAITCGADEDAAGMPETLYTYLYGSEAVEWNQVKPDGPTKKKRLYLLCESETGREFYRLEAEGVIALKIHRNLKKGDCVVVKGRMDKTAGVIHVAQIGRYASVSSKLASKAE